MSNNKLLFYWLSLMVVLTFINLPSLLNFMLFMVFTAVTLIILSQGITKLFSWVYGRTHR